MKTPAFWYAPTPSALARSLSPIGWVYGRATARRLARGRSWAPGPAVLCIGNLTAGGAGKTPVVRDLSRRLVEHGRQAHVISRGYGRDAGAAAGGAPLRVAAEGHDAGQVGDEPLMLARGGLPVWVSSDRPAAAQAAVAAGATALVLDDGHQDPSLAKTLSLVVVDGGLGFGNGFLVPAGPLREPIAAGLARADAVVLVGEDARGIARSVDRLAPGLPVLTCRVRPGPEIARLTERPILAFAGMAHPTKFFETLSQGGCQLAAQLAFADHHAYGASEIDDIKRRAAAMNATPVTTEKDLCRLSPEQAKGIEVLTIALEWDDEAALGRVLRPVVS